MCQAAINAFHTARQIELLLGELEEQLDELGEDTSLSTQQRHLAIRQICDIASAQNAKIEAYAKEFLENNVEKCASMKVEGVEFGDGERYVAGMIYGVKPQHKVEILNKDDESWGKLIVALVNAGYAKAIQKRLTPSYFVGSAGQRALEAAAGMIGCSTEDVWSITKPKAS